MNAALGPVVVAAASGTLSDLAREQRRPNRRISPRRGDVASQRLGTLFMNETIAPTG